MTLRLRHLRLKAITNNGPYAANISFKPGLNVIWADNTKGKSTCTQGMLYALGLERMLSPRREIPLPYAMTTFLKNDDDTQQEISESSVSLEIENGAGNVITVHRSVKKAGIDNRLITVDFGPTLTSNQTQTESKKFFVIDAGAALREDGFHHFLEQFLGWELPVVRRYEGSDCKLYLETVFPLFWVEQKQGWSSIPAAIPKYLKIREVHKRAVEFILDLDVHKLDLKKQRLAELIERTTRDWRAIWDEMDRFARRNGAKIESLPQTPTVDLEDISRGYVLIAERSGWVALEALLRETRARASHLNAISIPEVEATEQTLILHLQLINNEVEKANRRRIAIYHSKQLKTADIESLIRRIESLTEDLHKNQDVQKIQRYSGTMSSLTPDHCPTCQQALVDSLLSQDALTAVMPIEDNIEYIRSQLGMFEDICRREQEELKKLEVQAAQIDRELREFYSKIRTIRADLVAPSGNPSAAMIEERVRAEAKIRDLEAIQTALEDTVERMKLQAAIYEKLLKARSDLPRDDLSDEDKQKLKMLTELLQRQASEYGFSTFEPDELSIDVGSYRPQKEGYEIGFETSASDAIRLKWAYQLGLLEMSHFFPTNHPGMLLFDEPRQQSSSKVSFARLLERAASHQRSDQQVVISTSEDLDTLNEILARIECTATIFSGYVIQPVEAE